MHMKNLTLDITFRVHFFYLNTFICSKNMFAKHYCIFISKLNLFISSKVVFIISITYVNFSCNNKNLGQIILLNILQANFLNNNYLSI